MKALITNEIPSRGSTREAVERILDDIELAAGYIEQNDPEVDNAEDVAFNQILNGILEDAGNMSNSELRRRIRPQSTDPIQLRVINVSGERFITANLDDDQWAMLNRKMRESIEALPVDLPNDETARMIEANRIPEIRQLLQLLESHV